MLPVRMSLTTWTRHRRDASSHSLHAPAPPAPCCTPTPALPHEETHSKGCSFPTSEWEAQDAIHSHMRNANPSCRHGRTRFKPTMPHPRQRFPSRPAAAHSLALMRLDRIIFLPRYSVCLFLSLSAFGWLQSCQPHPALWQGCLERAELCNTRAFIAGRATRCWFLPFNCKSDHQLLLQSFPCSQLSMGNVYFHSTSYRHTTNHR